MDLHRANHQGTTVAWVQAEGGNGGANDEVYGGRCRHAARGAEQEAEDGGGWVWATSRWTAFRARKGGGEWAELRGAATTTATNGDGRIEKKRSRKRLRKVGQGARIKVVINSSRV